MGMVQAIIGGDIVPTISNLELFNNGDLEALIGSGLIGLLSGCDIRIFNLEVPLVDQAAPIPKCGPPLIAPTSTVRGLKALNPSLIALANNHILDQGEQGLKSTVAVLKENGIPYVGAGSSLAEAGRPYIIERGGLRIGFYACAEQEFSIATESTAGANPFDPLESPDHIAALKAECDRVIVLYHGGKEHYRYPSPYLQKVCRKIVQKGADLVVCQHSHCIGCYEEYQGSTIVYGQGNFIFDLTESEFWQTSLLLKVSFGETMAVEYLPICKRGKSVELAQADLKAEILEQFRQRSAQILEEGFIKGQYKLFAQAMSQKYLNSLAGHGVWMQRIDIRLFGGQLIRRKYSTAKKLMLRNYIECEAHRELLIEGLRGELTVK